MSRTRIVATDDQQKHAPPRARLLLYNEAEVSHVISDLALLGAACRAGSDVRSPLEGEARRARLALRLALCGLARSRAPSAA